MTLLCACVLIILHLVTHLRQGACGTGCWVPKYCASGDVACNVSAASDLLIRLNGLDLVFLFLVADRPSPVPKSGFKAFLLLAFTSIHGKLKACHRGLARRC
jgi:hypothetical protein